MAMATTGADAPRRHPDLFSEAEAATYLCVTESQLETLEAEFGLKGWKVGRAKVYHRRDLDATALRMVGLTVPRELTRGQDLKMAR